MCPAPTLFQDAPAASSGRRRAVRLPARGLTVPTRDWSRVHARDARSGSTNCSPVDRHMDAYSVGRDNPRQRGALGASVTRMRRNGWGRSGPSRVGWAKPRAGQRGLSEKYLRVQSRISPLEDNARSVSLWYLAEARLTAGGGGDPGDCPRTRTDKLRLARTTVARKGLVGG